MLMVGLPNRYKYTALKSTSWCEWTQAWRRRGLYPPPQWHFKKVFYIGFHSKKWLLQPLWRILDCVQGVMWLCSLWNLEILVEWDNDNVIVMINQEESQISSSITEQQQPVRRREGYTAWYETSSRSPHQAPPPRWWRHRCCHCGQPRKQQCRRKDHG